MIEKIIIKDYNNDLETKDSLNRVKAVDGSGNDILVSPGVVANSGGCGVFVSENRLEQYKWYRMAIGNVGSVNSSVLINISKIYINGAPGSQLFYVSADGCSNNPTVIQIAQGGVKYIGKVRIIYKATSTDKVMLDFYVYAFGSNSFKLAYSNNVEFTFLKAPEEVSADIPEGYSVKEFTF